MCILGLYNYNHGMSRFHISRVILTIKKLICNFILQITRISIALLLINLAAPLKRNFWIDSTANDTKLVQQKS
jgi:hypothetical protein